MVALAFSLFLVGVICLVADAAVLYGWSARLQAAAQVAAESGADAVSPSFLYGASGSCPGAAAGARRCAVSIVDVEPQDRRAGLYAFERSCIEAGDRSASIARTPEQPQSPDGTACDTDGCRVVAVVSKGVALPIPVPGFATSVQVRGEFRAAPVVGAEAPALTCVGASWVPSTPSPSR